MGTEETVLEKVNSLAARLIGKAPGHLRVAFNEDDNSQAPQPECAHFLKLDERRLGRDFELYNFMAKAAGEQAVVVMLLEELVLPLQNALLEAFAEGIVFCREQGPVFRHKQGDWADLLDTLVN